MNRAVRLFILLLVPLATLCAAERKPNVVLILIDDFGYECVTANGGESYKTPVMDNLAATGVRFEQCQSCGIHQADKTVQR
jgi:arylsulfatase A